MAAGSAPAVRKVTPFACGCVHHWLSDGEMRAAVVCSGHTPAPMVFAPAVPAADWEAAFLAWHAANPV